MLVIALFLAMVQAAPAVDTPAATAGKPDRDKMLCRRLGVTGSRLPKKLHCASAADWAAAERQAQRNMSDLKSRNMAGNPTNGIQN